MVKIGRLFQKIITRFVTNHILAGRGILHRHATNDELIVESVAALLEVAAVRHLGEKIRRADQVPANNVAWIIKFDLVEIEFVACEMHDHAANANVLGQSEFGKVAAKEVSTARDMAKCELGAVAKVLIAYFVAYVAGVVKKGSDNSHLRAAGPQAICRLYATLIAGNKARNSQRHIEAVLHVVIRGITAQVSGVATGEESFEVVKGEPEFVERHTRKGL